MELSYRADKEKWDFGKILKFIKLRSKIVWGSEDFVWWIKKEFNGIGIGEIIILNYARFLNDKILTGDKHFEGFSNAIIL